MTTNPTTPAAPLSGLLDALRDLIQQGRQQADGLGCQDIHAGLE